MSFEDYYLDHCVDCSKTLEEVALEACTGRVEKIHDAPVDIWRFRMGGDHLRYDGPWMNIKSRSWDWKE
jgi:hypothetical protein